MKRPWIYLLILVIFAISSLAGCSPNGATTGKLNCSHGGEVCVNLSTVKSFAMGDAVPLKITVTGSKDTSDLGMSVDTGMEITMDGPQTWEKNVANPTIDGGVAYGDFAIKAGQTLTFNRVLHFPQKEGYFRIIVEVVNDGRIIDAVDSFYVLLTKEAGGQVSMAGTPLPSYTPNVALPVYGPGTQAPPRLTRPTYPPMATPVAPLISTPVAPASGPYPYPSPNPYP
jgi:hypothetical protein